MNRAVFFDRDGVLNLDTDYISSINEVKLVNSAVEIVTYCRDAGYMIFVVTNQPVIARGLIDEAELTELNRLYAELFLSRNEKAVIDKIYYCPHHPNANVEKYRQICDCRKPKPGMLFAAQKEFNIDLENSFMVGDRISDIIAGSLAGCRTIQCLTGKHTDRMIQTDLEIPKDISPDFIINDLSEITGIIK